jgi:TPR repeat protein
MEEGQPLKGTAPQREEERVWPALAGWLLALALLGALLYVTLTNMPAHHLVRQKPVHFMTVVPPTPPPETRVAVVASSNMMVNGQPIQIPHKASANEIEPTPQAPIPTPWIETAAPVPNTTVIVQPVAYGAALPGGLNTTAIACMVGIVWLLISLLTYAATRRRGKAASTMPTDTPPSKPSQPLNRDFKQQNVGLDSVAVVEPAEPFALEQYLSDAQAGDPKAQHALGVVYYRANDFGEAAKWFKKASEQGRKGSTYKLAQIYDLGGHGVTKNLDYASQLYRQAAEQGHSGAQNALGLMYHQKLGPAASLPDEQRWKEAAKWFSMAANQGWVSAQCNLGVVYLHKLEGSDRFKEAVHWLKKAADSGLKEAFLDLAIAYCGLNDFSSAMHWFQEAAKSGKQDIVPHALYNIGVLHYHGRGVREDRRQAMEYFVKAANLNESKAAETLGAFLGREKGAPWKRLPEESSLYEDLARKSKEYAPMK